ncbi:hypothetical protein DOY81_001540 [Sarcophaga bullata]|nr:hypothetical protein DOY81_001540 [Sarcophaga bullata]
MEMKELETKYPCRSKFIRSLFDLIGNTDECFPRTIFVYGHAGTGKTCIIKDFLSLVENEETRCVLINCVECYSMKILLENILDGLFYNSELQDQERCESLQEFLKCFQKCNSHSTQRNYIIAFDDADRIRDMEYSILPSLLRIQDLTGLNVCVILISQIPFEKYHLRTGLSDVITIQCPQYSKSETLTILGTQYKIALKLLKIHINELWESETIRNKENILRQYNIVEKITHEFFCNYLNVFLSVFYKACRDVPELKMTANKLFLTYMEPVLNGAIEITEISKLWRNIASPLRTALSQVYMRSDDFNKNSKLLPDIYSDQSIRKLAQNLDLPFYAKYLLIAAFLASNNSAKEDKRLYVKYHGKQRKRMKTVNAKAKVTEKMFTSVGPKSFSVDRLLAIFYSILDEKVGLTCNLLSQISTLVRLKLLGFVSGENNIMDGSARLQCTVGLEFVLYIGRVVGFNVSQYLCDFM